MSKQAWTAVAIPTRGHWMNICLPLRELGYTKFGDAFGDGLLSEHEYRFACKQYGFDVPTEAEFVAFVDKAFGRIQQ